MARPLRKLELRFALEDPDDADFPDVAILVDGEDRFVRAGQGHFRGFDPRDMLGVASPLLPQSSSRRVAVYRCSCGEAGCGVIAPLIAEVDGKILWTDFRDYTGVFVGPTVEEDWELPEGKELPLADIWFDAEQYRVEVERASADSSWETERRKTSRLLAQYLDGERATLERWGYELTWVSLFGSDPRAYRVSLWKGDGQYVVELRAPEGTPEEQAAAMAEDLLRSGPDGWMIASRGGSAFDLKDF